MAQRVNALSFRLGTNIFWSAHWYSNKNYASLFFEDNLITLYLKNIFELRGFFYNRCFIRRSSESTFIFLEIYGNPYFKYAIPRRYRKIKKYRRIINFNKVYSFLNKLINNKIYLSINNLFMINRVHKHFLRRLRNQFNQYKRYRFSMTILGVFSIILRLKGALFLSRIISFELEFLEKKRKNKITWHFTSFIGNLIESLKTKREAIHGARVQLKGRFRGIKRPKLMRFRDGMVPFNTIRALIDYAYVPAITINGSFGIKIWICYKNY
jgi:hypothetical protein